MNQYKVRQAKIQDLDKLAVLFDGYRHFYTQGSDLAGAKEFLRARMENEQSIVLVAEEGDNLLGFTQLYPSFSSVSMKSTWILNDLFVAAEARRRGIAQSLLKEACQFAKSKGAFRVDLETGEENLQAQKLYHKEGWKLGSGVQYFSFMLD